MARTSTANILASHSRKNTGAMVTLNMTAFNKSDLVLVTLYCAIWPTIMA